MTEPMTAAEWDTHRRIGGTALSPQWDKRIAAALEEREALLVELEAVAEQVEYFRDQSRIQRARVKELEAETAPINPLSTDASVGALVRRIREEKPFAYLTWSGSPVCFALDKNGLTFALDSLLPKEPEVVTGESGRQYRRTGGKAIEARHICADGSPTYWATVGGVPVIDAPVVAKLMAKGGKDGEWAMLEQEYQKRFGEDSNAK